MTRTLLALFALLLSAPAHAQEDAASFFKGKTLRIVVGSGVGSGYDITARTLARHMGAHIPGNPTVIVQNQPGAGGAIAARAAATATPDGYTLGMMALSAFVAVPGAADNLPIQVPRDLMPASSPISAAPIARRR